MKKTILIFISLLSFNNLLAQVSPLSQIKPSLLSVVNNTSKTFPFFGTKDQLLSAFGQPSTIEIITYADMLDYPDIKAYHYNGINFWLEKRPTKIINKSNKDFLVVEFADRYDTVEVPYYSYLMIDFDKNTRKITSLKISLNP